MDERSKTALQAQKVELERFIGGWLPESDDLSNIPQIDDWEIVVEHKAARLKGSITGHPSPGVDRISRSMTSDILWIDRNEGWARTASRFYRLGAKLPQAHPNFTREEAIAYACLRVGIEPPAFVYDSP